MKFKRITNLVKAVLLTLVLLPFFASAQNYPSRPIKIIAPFPAGGTSDLIGRIVAQRLGEELGQTIVIENRPGANGTIGLEAGARAVPDGYTLMIASSGIILNNPSFYNKLSYDWLKDFQPITFLGIASQVLVVNPSFSAKTLAELVELAKAKPDVLNFGSGGKGNTAHLAAEKFKLAAGLNITHIPYKGNGQATAALVAGEVQMVFSDSAPALPFISSKKLIPLAVTSLQRSKFLPDVPTMAEQGFPNFESVVWWTISAPTGVPEPIMKKLHASLAKVMVLPEVEDAFGRLGVATMFSAPEKVNELVRKELVVMGNLIKRLNIPKE